MPVSRQAVTEDLRCCSSPLVALPRTSLAPPGGQHQNVLAALLTYDSNYFIYMLRLFS